MQMSKNTVHKTNKKNTRKQKQKQKICCSNALALTLVQPCRCPILFLSCSQSQCCLSAGEKVSFFVGQWKNKKVKKKNREFHCIWTFFPQSPYQFLCSRVYVIKKSALGKYLTSTWIFSTWNMWTRRPLSCGSKFKLNRWALCFFSSKIWQWARLDALSVFLLSRLLSSIIIKWKPTLERTFPAALCSSRFCSVVFACSAASCIFLQYFQCNIFIFSAIYCNIFFVAIFLGFLLVHAYLRSQDPRILGS